MKKRGRYARLLLTSAVGMTAPGAWAQGEDDLFDLQLEELEQIVVSAQKRSENLQEVPLSISAFLGDDLVRYGVFDTQSLQIATPGLIFSNTGSSAQPYLRGVGTRFAFAGLEPSIATYVDDRYVARAQATIFQLADVERVEVLRGPQGTLYGRNATGGAIRVVTREVEEELSGHITGTLGDYDLRAVSGTVNVPLNSKLATRLTALVRKRDGYADNLDPRGVSELDDRDVTVLRGKLRWDISEKIGSLLTVEYSDRRDNFGNDLVDLSPAGLNAGIAAGGISGTGRGEVATAIASVIDDEQISADLRFDVELPWATLVSITTYHDFQQNANTDADGTSAAFLDAVGVPQDAEAFSQELQLISASDGAWHWIAGAYFFDETADFEILADRGTPELESQGDQRAGSTAFALFGQATWVISPRWSVTFGGRWSYEEKTVRLAASALADITLAPVPFAREDDWSEFTPKLTVMRNTAQGMLYVSYARGFKSGGYNYPASVQGGLPLEPEVLDMFEFGWKTKWLDGRLQLNGSLFFYDYRDLQVTRAVAGSGLIVTDNAADAEVLGADLDLAWMLSDWLSLTAGLSLLDSQYDVYDATALVFNAALGDDPDAAGMSRTFFDAAGERLLRAPDSSFFVSAEAWAPLGPLRGSLTVAYAWTDDYEFDFVADPSTRRLMQKSHGLLSARASVETPDQRWTLSLWATNLTGEDDYFSDIVANAAGIRGSPGAPRVWGLDMTFRF